MSPLHMAIHKIQERGGAKMHFSATWCEVQWFSVSAMTGCGNTVQLPVESSPARQCSLHDNLHSVACSAREWVTENGNWVFPSILQWLPFANVHIDDDDGENQYLKEWLTRRFNILNGFKRGHVQFKIYERKQRWGNIGKVGKTVQPSIGGEVGTDFEECWENIATSILRQDTHTSLRFLHVWAFPCFLEISCAAYSWTYITQAADIIRRASADCCDFSFLSTAETSGKFCSTVHWEAFPYCTYFGTSILRCC